MKDLEDYALQQTLAGQEIPGWKAVEGRSLRRFDDQEAAFSALRAAGVEDTLLYERVPLSLAKLEKALGKKEFLQIIGSHIIQPAGKPTLVPDTDKRPAIDAAAAAFGPA